MGKEVVIQESRNNHTLKSTREVVVKNVDEEGTILKLNITGDGIVTHGEHGTIKTESQHIFKYVQQEYNPVTKQMNAAFD